MIQCLYSVNSHCTDLHLFSITTTTQHVAQCHKTTTHAKNDEQWPTNIRESSFHSSLKLCCLACIGIFNDHLIKNLLLNLVPKDYFVQISQHLVKILAREQQNSFYSQYRTHQYCQRKQNLSQKYDNHPCCSPGVKLEALYTSIVILWWGWEMKVERLDSCTD